MQLTTKRVIQRQARWFPGLLLVAAAVALPMSGLADDKDSKEDPVISGKTPQYGEAAMAQLKIARLFYKENKFKQAAVAFHQAYALQERVEFLFNAARSEQRAMQLDLAKKHFKQCLKAKNAPEPVIRRAKVHLGEIESMQAALANARASAKKAEAAKTPKPAPVKPKIAKPLPPPPGGWKSTAGWGTVAAGAVLLGLGGYFTATYASGQSDLDARLADRDANNKVKNVDWQTYENEQNDLNSTATMGTTALVVGTLAAGAGAWMLLTAPSKHPAAKATLAPMGTRGLAVVIAF